MRPLSRASTPNCRAEATVLTAPTYSAYSTGVSGILCRISRSSMDSSISVLMWCLWQFLTTINVRCLLGLLPSP